MAHMTICATALFFAKYVGEPIRRRLTASEHKQLSEETECDDPFIQQKPLHFRIFDLPPELQIAAFEQLIESWSLKISTHQNSCRREVLCSISVGLLHPCSGTESVLKCQIYISSILHLQLIHPHVRPIVLEVFRKKYTGTVIWSACGINTNAAHVKWRPPEATRHLLTTKTSKVEILRVVRPCYVKRLFPVAKIMYHVRSDPLRWTLNPSFAISIMQHDADLDIVWVCRTILTDGWHDQESDHLHITYDYMMRFYTNISRTKETEIVVQLKPTETGLVVTKRWSRPSRASLSPLWMEKLRVVKKMEWKKPRALLSWRIP